MRFRDVLACFVAVMCFYRSAAKQMAVEHAIGITSVIKRMYSQTVCVKYLSICLDKKIKYHKLETASPLR